VFFSEEEKRIAPVLQSGLERARDLAQDLPIPDLIEELSQGVHFDQEFDVAELVLVPAYWSTPLLLYNKIRPDRMMMLFGVRPPDASLVPGEAVPDALLKALKAMADPTRLNILRYLANDSLTPSQLSRRLRLRAPTVTHHLNTLRLAGLVHLDLEEGSERRYTVRRETVKTICSMLHSFLE
jgi:DNA-binding transcriptional ArsR family regulator